MRRLVVEHVSRGWLGRWFRNRGWAGVCVVLPFVSLIVYWQEPSPGERAHERMHAWQADRMGFWGWWAAYLWGLRLGYRLNPLEVEAREAQERIDGGGA